MTRSGGSKKNGFKQSLQITPELREFLGREKVSRPMLTKLMWAYFKQHKLLDESDKRFVVSDAKLKALTGEDRFQAFSFMKLLNKHIVKTGGASAAAAADEDEEEEEAEEEGGTAPAEAAAAPAAAPAPIEEKPEDEKKPEEEKLPVEEKKPEEAKPAEEAPPPPVPEAPAQAKEEEKKEEPDATA